MALSEPLSGFIDMARADITSANLLSAGRLMGNVQTSAQSITSYIEPSLEIRTRMEQMLDAVSELQQHLAVMLSQAPEKTEALRQTALDRLALLEGDLESAKLNSMARSLGF